MANNSGSRRRATPKEIERFLTRVSKGEVAAYVAEDMGFSRHWGYKVLEKQRQKKQELDRERAANIALAPPEPKKFHDLDGGVKDTLRDFLLFRRVFLARDDVPWARDAAEQVVEYLTSDKDELVVINVPPGAGKSTLFTMDIPLWLVCGGGTLDPVWGRALRMQIGSHALTVSQDYVARISRILEVARPYYDHKMRREAEMCFIEAFGRFKPDPKRGEQGSWSQEKVHVAQIGDHGIYEKEATFHAISRDSKFLGGRCNLSIWDDLVNNQNSRNVEASQQLAEWFEEEAETRVEPGGALLLVGQRLSAIDLYRNRLDTTFENENNEEEQLYKHIVYPAHHDATCDGDHRQWDAQPEGEGCLLDEKRLSWRKLKMAMSKGKFNTVYQQQDGNPDEVLVDPAWIYGGTDAFGFEAVGCLDTDRHFWEWPKEPTFTYATVDPSATNYWVAMVWAVGIESGRRYLIFGTRKRMRAGTDEGFLDYDPDLQKLVGLMPELQQKSIDLGHPIFVWVVEQNAAHRYLFQTYAFKRFQQHYKKVEVISHQTGRNKNDTDFGVDALVGQPYKLGLKRLPYGKGFEERNFLRTMIDELTKYPNYVTDDIVMADWFGEVRLDHIRRKAKAFTSSNYGAVSGGFKLPPYLQAQRKFVPHG